MMRALTVAMATGAALAAAPAAAQPLTLKPIVDARLRYEGVDQDGLPRDADAITLRLRAGGELVNGPWSLLVEGEGTVALNENYNSSTNGKTAYPIVADPQNIDLNRFALQYRGLKKTIVTLGRQRINLDDQRFVGSVAWRQNEQTFDAVRVESGALGPLHVDLTYSWSNRTIYGVDSPFQSIGGTNILAQAGMKLGPVTAKGFAYIVDQDQAGRRQFSSQTYGLRAVGVFPLNKAAKLTLIGSYARQTDYHDNPGNYAADYWLGEVALAVKGFTLTGGYEALGASSGAAFTSFQTPLATLHKFQGWADKFLTTPANGIHDRYASAGYAVPGTTVSMLVAYHRFDSDRLSIDYGHEWDGQIGFRPTKHTALLIKYADYRAKAFATDTQKLWLQLDYGL